MTGSEGQAKRPQESADPMVVVVPATLICEGCWNKIESGEKVWMKLSIILSGDDVEILDTYRHAGCS